MDSQPGSDGPDGSSIKPVSSLRARFENMNMTRPADDVPKTLPSRPISPAPKPDKLRSVTVPAPAKNDALGAPPSTRPKPREKLGLSGLQIPEAADNPPRSPGRMALSSMGKMNILPPPASPRPVQAVDMPALTVEPPHSPPKRTTSMAVGEQPNFLHTDSVVKQSSPTVPQKQFKIPSRPHTPVLEPRRSPRLHPSSGPPSPPPPRRSAELRRDRETKPAPPPINRTEKPLIPSRNSFIADTPQPFDLRGRQIEKSPFNSPPSSNGTPEEEEQPPVLPTRPRPQSTMIQPTTVARSKAIDVGFEPPPVHHSVATRRREREEIGVTPSGLITPQFTGERRPALPNRPVSVILEPPGRAGLGQMLPPPPRPPRPGGGAAVQDPLGANGAQKRVVSTPVTQHPPPPKRTHGRSMTVDRTSSVVPAEFRTAPVPIRGPTELRPPEGGAAPPSAASSRSKQDENGHWSASTSFSAVYPDSSTTNRRSPYIKQGVHEIHAKYDTRVLDVCGDFVCTSGAFTRVWSLLDGELLVSLAMGEGIKGTSVAFKPGADVSQEGARIWIGNNFGELMEADIGTQSIVASKPNIHGRYEVIKIYRHFNELWTLDEAGTLHVWGPDEDGVPNLTRPSSQSYRLPRGHTFSLVVGEELWHATGKEIRVFLPTLDGRTQFQVLIRPLVQDTAGEVTSGTLSPADPNKVLFGHIDGKVSIYSRSDYSCTAVVSMSTFKINSLTSVGDDLWAGYNTGKVCVYDTRQTPWVVKKDFQGHEGGPVVKLVADRSSFYKLDRYQVVSLGADNMMRAWDALLQDDWLEEEMQSKDTEYCEFDKLKALVMTWNAGASTPNSLRYSESDATFIQNLLRNADSPDILIFGFQELVDLEDKTATAKRLLKPKKKEGSDQERMSHQYRDWRDFLVRSLDDHMRDDLYHLLHTATLVGLFTCIFVKADLRDRISNLSSTEVKRGMGGLHGNKGAIMVRFLIDDTSLCFVNCHLAAGQSQAQHRHNDIAAILEATNLPIERDPAVRIDNYVGGGDGTMVLDHELCVLNGDLNYRIDTMSRDTVVAAVRAGNLAKLLERDQLLVARRRNPLFKLRAFEEMPIEFAPTYKYDVGTDNYDSSEKKRSPAWCDRLLYRGGPGRRVEQLDYGRHDVRVSDHRPVTGNFRFTVKRINPKRRAVAWMECQQRWEDLRDRLAHQDKLYYLTYVIGYDAVTAKKLIKDASARKAHRSPSRHREQRAMEEKAY